MKLFLKVMATLLVMAVVTGCSSTSTSTSTSTSDVKLLPMMVPDSSNVLRKKYASATTVNDTWDSVMTVYQLGLGTGDVTSTGEPIMQQTDTRIVISPKFTAQLAQGMMAGTAPALINAEAQKDIAKTQAKAFECKPGTQYCNSNVSTTVLQGGTAMAQGGAAASNAASASQADAAVDANTSRPHMAPLPPLRN